MTDDGDEIIDGPTLAARLGLSVAAVSKLASEGVIVRASRGRYRLWPSVLAYIERLRQSASGRGSPTADARARLLEAQAQRAEFALERERGEWLRSSEVEMHMTKMCRYLRTAVLACSARVNGRLPHLTKVDVETIDDELRQCLTEMSQWEPGDDEKVDNEKA